MCTYMHICVCVYMHVHTHSHIYANIFFIYVCSHIFKPFFAILLHLHNEKSISQCVKLLNLEIRDCCMQANSLGLVIYLCI